MGESLQTKKLVEIKATEIAIKEKREKIQLLSSEIKELNSQILEIHGRVKKNERA